MTVVLLLYLLVEDVAGGVGENDINVIVTPSHYLQDQHFHQSTWLRYPDDPDLKF